MATSRVHELTENFGNFTLSSKKECDSLQNIPITTPDGKRMKLSCLAYNPNVWKIDGFMSDRECDDILSVSNGHFIPSLTVGNTSQDQSRTSSSAHLVNVNDRSGIVSKMRHRSAALANVSNAQIEPIQAVHYVRGQKYDYHTDFFDPWEWYQATPNLGGNRSHTILAYLNDVDGADETGNGSTCFKNADGRTLCIPPSKGAALFWKNMENGNTIQATAHSGTPPIRGEKACLNIWIREHAPTTPIW